MTMKLNTWVGIVHRFEIYWIEWWSVCQSDCLTLIIWNSEKMWDFYRTLLTVAVAECSRVEVIIYIMNMISSLWYNNERKKCATFYLIRIIWFLETCSMNENRTRSRLDSCDEFYWFAKLFNYHCLWVRTEGWL